MVKRKTLLAILLVFMVGGGIANSCTLTKSGYEGKKSDHFDGRKFFNTPRIEHSLWGLAKWILTRNRAPWPGWVDIAAIKNLPQRLSGGEVQITFINHATVLVQWHDMNILTDPVWSRRTSPVSWAGPKRVKLPGIALDELPPIDVILISHNHYDAMDIATLRKIQKRHRAQIFVGLGNSKFLSKKKVPMTRDMDWWEKVELKKGWEVVCVPARHFSSRTLWDRNETLWASYVVTTPYGNLFFAGDSGYGPHFTEIGDKYGPFRLALLPIGAYEPRWFMAPVHMNPSESVKAHVDLNSQTSMGIHFGTFPLTDEAIDDPVNELKIELKKEEYKDLSFFVLENGQSKVLTTSEW